MNKSRLLLSVVFFFSVSLCAQETTEYFYVGAKRIMLKPSTSQVFVKYKSTTEESQAKRTLTSSNLFTGVDKVQFGVGNKVIIDLKPSERTVAKSQAAISRLSRDASIEAVFPGYVTEKGDVLYVTNEIVVAPLKGTAAALTAAMSNLGLSVIEVIGRGTSHEVFVLRSSSQVNPFKAANVLVESGLVSYAHPNFTQLAFTASAFQDRKEDPKKPKTKKSEPSELQTDINGFAKKPAELYARRIVSQPKEKSVSERFVQPRDPEVLEIPKSLQAGEIPVDEDALRRAKRVSPNTLPSLYSSLTPNDPNYPNQWWLNNTGQFGGIPGADVDGPEAWFITQGDTNVAVSVWDAGGYDLGHYELEGKLINPYDAARDDDDPSPLNEFSNHGTPCVGIIGALTNNGRGVASIGNRVKVMPVDIATIAPNAQGQFGTDDATLLRAANRVTQTPGIVAVSNSWGGGTITAGRLQAVELCRTQARGGKGAVFMASSGNGSSPAVNGYPANAPFVLAIGAITFRDIRASFSNWGDSLDVVAPGDFSGITSGILTIDRRGSAGYDAGDTTFFGGTSAACPVAAGVLSLIASSDTTLNERQLATLLERTSDKITGYPFVNFPGRPNGTWNFELGYGRVNARRGVQAALNLTGFAFANPSPGTLWQKGTTVQIRWATTGVAPDDVKLELLRGGNSVETISATTPNTGLFDYTVPQNVDDGSNYALRISTLDNQISHTSAQFRISSAGRFTETYNLGSLQNSIVSYSDLGTQGDVISPDNTDDANAQAVDIGFTFNYVGVPFTKFVLNTNGFIKLGDTAPSKADLFPAGIRDQTPVGSALASTDPLDQYILSPFNVDLIGTDSAEYRVFTSGSAPNRVTTIQFKNLIEKKDTSAGLGQRQYRNLSFQVQLFEGSNNIAFVYGGFLPSTASAQFRTSVVGLKSTDPSEGISISKGSAQAWGLTTIFVQGTDRANYRNDVNIEVGRRFLFRSVQPASRLTVSTLPASPIVNRLFTATVTVVDDNNNPVRLNEETTVTLSSSGGSGVLGGTLSQVIYPWQSSLTFTGLSYSAEEPFTLTATSSNNALTPATREVNVRAVPLPLNHNQFLVTRSVGTYTDLGTNGTVIQTANFDDANSAPVDIGFPFVYRGQSFNQFVFNTNGFIKLGTDAPSKPDLFIETPQDQTGLNGAIASVMDADTNIISVMNHDLQAGTLPAEYRVHTSGDAPNRVTTIQWKNVRDKNRTGITTPAIQFNNMNFQIKLFEGSNDIEFVYGTFTGSTNTAAFRTFGVGLKGGDTTGTQVLTLQKASATSFQNAILQRFAAATLNMSRTVTAGLPVSGQTIRFNSIKPPEVIAVVPILTSQTALLPFNVQFTTQDGLGLAQGVTETTEFELSVVEGDAALSHSPRVTLQTGQSGGLFSGVLLNTTSNTDVKLRVSQVSGQALRAGETNTFSVTTEAPLGLLQNFTSTVFPPAGWSVINPDSGSITWVRSPTVGRPTAGSAFMNFWNYLQVGQTDTLKTSFFKVPQTSVFAFELAYSTFLDAADSLEVWASLDTGKTFSRRLFRKGGVELSTAPSVSSAFTPTAAQWRTESIDLRSIAGETVQLAFVTINQYGNNLYVDSIRTESIVLPTRLFVSTQPPAQFFAGTPFSFTVQTRDDNNSSRILLDSTTVTVTVENGTGELGGPVTRVIPAGQSSVIFSGLTYPVAGSGVRFRVSVTAGTPLTEVVTDAVNVISPISSLYRLVHTHGFYSPLRTSQSVNPTDPDDGVGVVRLPYAFRYNGVSYDSLTVNTNGMAVFGGLSSSMLNGNLFTTTAPFNVIAPWWDDLLLLSRDSLRFSVEGSEPNRVTTVQFSNVRDFWNNTGANAGLLNFQFKLYEQSNIVEFVYGPKAGGVFSTSSTASVGVKGVAGGANDFIDAVSGSSTVGVSTRSSITDFPTPGRVYRFVPTNQVILPAVSVTSTMASGSPSTVSFDPIGVKFTANVTVGGEMTMKYYNFMSLQTEFPENVTGVVDGYIEMSTASVEFNSGVLHIAVDDLPEIGVEANRFKWLWREDSTQAWINIGGIVVNDTLFSVSAINALGEVMLAFGEPVSSAPSARALVPTRFELSQNYPNPFNPSTTIAFAVPQSSEVNLKVFDMLGREVATLVNGRKEVGRHQINFNARNLSSGVYFYRLQAGSYVDTKKMVLIK